MVIKPLTLIRPDRLNVLLSDSPPPDPYAGKRVLIVVQNLPVPLDRRVWLECQALKANGYHVSVICPKGPGDPARQTIDGIHIYKYRPAAEAEGVRGFVWEFVYSWARTARLSLKVRREQGFDILQACNPPDTYWLLALLWKIRGISFVYDQHDLNPELFQSRFGMPTTFGGKVQYHGLKWLERMTYRVADRVISTNESYKNLAVTRGHRDPAEVTVVRSGPDTTQMRPVYPPESARNGAEHLLVYLGIMGPQDGVNIVLEVVNELVNNRGRTGVRAVLMGFGDCLERLQAQSLRMGLTDVVTFTGRADREMVSQYLSAADVGLCPDPKTPLNDVSTMNKTMEYMAYGLPSVAFDLLETRVSGADTVLYVESEDIQKFSDAVEYLLDNPELRADLGVAARERVARDLDWRAQSVKYVGVFDELSGRDGEPVDAHAPVFATTSPAGLDYVDLDDADELRRFIIERNQRPADLGSIPTELLGTVVTFPSADRAGWRTATA